MERKDRCQSMAELYQALFGEQISEALPVAAREGFVPGKKISYRSREKVLSHTRMQRQLMEVSRKRQMRIRRIWMLGLAGVMLLVLAVLLWQAGQGRFLSDGGQTGQSSKGISHSGMPVGKTEEPVPEATQTVMPTVNPDADQIMAKEGEQGSKAKDQQTEKPKQSSKTKDQRIEKPKQSSKAKDQKTPKPKAKQTSKPDAKRNTPTLRLQEDDHVAGDLDASE